VRAIKPDVYLVGEIWREAPDWLRGDRFDATMNYVFAAAAIAFAAGDRVSPCLVEGRAYDAYPGIDAAQFGQRIRDLLAQYDWETTQVQFNLLDSHDAPRLVSIARGDKATLRLATLFQMTFPGTPCIYYGDEIALRGTKRYLQPHRDHDARWPFPWHDEAAWDREMLDFFRQAIALRHAHPVLRRGQFDEIYAQAQQYAFLRHDHHETLLVVLNAGNEAAQISVPVGRHVSDGESLKPLFGSVTAGAVQRGHCAVNIPPRAGAVLSR
jgi:cyclomaltodextrinase